MFAKQSIKRDAFVKGFTGFYTGERKQIEYTRNSNALMYKAWQTTGDSIRKAMKEYD